MSQEERLHDSLDLTALKQQIAAEQACQQNRRKLMQYFYWGLAVTLGLTAFAVFGGRFSRTLALRTLDLANLSLIVCALLFFAPRIIVAYRQHQTFAKRFDAYAPNFIPRLSVWDTFRAIGTNATLSLAFLIGILFRNWIMFVGVLLILWLMWFYGYRRLLLWVYRGGLGRMNMLLRIFPGNYLLTGNRALVLMNMGQVDETMQIYQDLLVRGRRRNPYTIPIWLNNLGICLQLTEAYAQSLSMLESTIQISPSFSSPYDTLAGWYLEQQLDPERALALTEMALELTSPKNTSSYAVQQATSARALALTGRDTRAEAMIEQSLSTADSLPPAVCAEVNRQVGYARLAQGNREAAEAHFKRAISLDPNGLSAKLAQKALDTLEMEVP